MCLIDGRSIEVPLECLASMQGLRVTNARSALPDYQVRSLHGEVRRWSTRLVNPASPSVVIVVTNSCLEGYIQKYIARILEYYLEVA